MGVGYGAVGVRQETTVVEQDFEAKRILFVTLSPVDAVYSCSIRNEALIKGLIENGYHVDIVSISNRTGISRQTCYENEERCDVYFLDQGLSQNLIQRKKVANGGAINLFRWIYRRLSIFEYLPRSHWNSVKLDVVNRDYDYVISSSDPKNSHRIAKQLLDKLRTKPKWIQYWGDPLADDITRQLIYPKWFLRSVEKNILSMAQKIVYTSPITVERQKLFFPSLAERMEALPTPYLKIKRLEYVNKDYFVVGYHGSYNPLVRNICPLIEAIGTLGSDWLLEIVGPHNEIECVKPSNVTVRGQTGEIEQKEQYADILVVLMNITGGQIPGKLYYLAGINREILVIVDGEHADKLIPYIKSFNRYHVCLNQANRITEKLQEIRDGTQSLSLTDKLAPCRIANRFIADA